MKLITVLAGTLVAALGAGSAGAGPAPEIDLLWGVKVPLRDGVRLNATVFKPRVPAGPLPVIFTLTPYNSDTYYPRARYFAQNGYVYALVDVRGRGNSEGTFLPFENEGRDGHDVVEWLAGQPWCNGKVAMWGGSYAGYDQWATLQNFPPHLTTIVPAAAAAMGVDFPAQNNIRAPYLMQWATYTSGVTPQPNLFGDAAFWISKFRQLYLSQRPFRDFDHMVGNRSSWFQRVLQHPRVDELWKSLRPSAADYARIAIPILTITGHYDDDQYGAMHYYRSHMEHGTAEAQQRHFLVVGPWDHAGTRTPSARRTITRTLSGEATEGSRAHRRVYPARGLPHYSLPSPRPPCSTRDGARRARAGPAPGRRHRRHQRPGSAGRAFKERRDRRRGGAQRHVLRSRARRATSEGRLYALWDHGLVCFPSVDATSKRHSSQLSRSRFLFASYQASHFLSVSFSSGAGIFPTSDPFSYGIPVVLSRNRTACWNLSRSTAESVLTAVKTGPRCQLQIASTKACSELISCKAWALAMRPPPIASCAIARNRNTHPYAAQLRSRLVTASRGTVSSSLSAWRSFLLACDARDVAGGELQPCPEGYTISCRGLHDETAPRPIELPRVSGGSHPTSYSVLSCNGLGMGHPEVTDPLDLLQVLLSNLVTEFPSHRWTRTSAKHRHVGDIDIRLSPAPRDGRWRTLRQTDSCNTFVCDNPRQSAR